MAKNEVRETSQTKDVREYIELLLKLDDTEKAEVKGIMIGMQMLKERMAAQTA